MFSVRWRQLAQDRVKFDNTEIIIRYNVDKTLRAL